MTKLPEKDKVQFEDFFHTAFENAANAFSRFAGVEVHFDWLDFQDVPHEEVSNENNSLSIYTLISELKEDIAGKCYLNFAQTDAESLFKLCLQGTQSQSPTMQEALLLELDNILTASVLSVLSNKLKVNTYAYVPTLKKYTVAEFNKVLIIDEQLHNLAFKLITRFNVQGHNVSPEFYWLFNESLKLKMH